MSLLPTLHKNLGSCSDIATAARVLDATLQDSCYLDSDIKALQRQTGEFYRLRVASSLQQVTLMLLLLT